jgi:hypothetical protein
MQVRDMQAARLVARWPDNQLPRIRLGQPLPPLAISAIDAMAQASAREGGTQGRLVSAA